MLNDGYEFWHVDIDLSNASRLRFIDALIKTNSGLECGLNSRILFGKGLKRGNTGFFVVQIMPKMVEEFKKIAKPIEMKLPPKVCI